MVRKRPEQQSKAREIIDDVVEYLKPPPDSEPELKYLFRYKGREGQDYLVEHKGKTQRLSPKAFASWVYQGNIEILKRKIAPFQKAIDKYNLEVEKLKIIRKSRLRLSEVNDDNRESLERRIKEAWHNWEVEFRNERDTEQSRLALRRIDEMQRQLSRMRSQDTDEIFTGTFDKYYYDPQKLDVWSKRFAETGKAPTIRYKKEVFTGNVNDLISFYEGSIDFIEDNYLDALNDRLDGNKYYLRKLSK